MHNQRHGIIAGQAFDQLHAAQFIIRKRPDQTPTGDVDLRLQPGQHNRRDARVRDQLPLELLKLGTAFGLGQAAAIPARAAAQFSEVQVPRRAVIHLDPVPLAGIEMRHGVEMRQRCIGKIQVRVADHLHQFAAALQRAHRVGHRASVAPRVARHVPARLEVHLQIVAKVAVHRVVKRAARTNPIACSKLDMG